MNKSFFGIAASLCLFVCVSFAFAGEEVVPYDKCAAATPAPASPYCFLNPSFSLGFSEAGQAHYQFDIASPLLNISSVNLKTPQFPGFYLAGALPFALTDRLKVTLGASWAPGDNHGQGQDNFNDAAVRTWDSGDSDWVKADLLVSYVLAKDCAFIKDFSVVAGFRYDYHHMGLSGPTNGVGDIFTGPSDTIGLSVQTWEPVAGFTATFPGCKCGIFGGDIKLGVSGSPFAWGNVDFSEKFGGSINTLAIQGNLDAHQTEFYNLSAEATAISWIVCPGIQATVSIFADYTKFYGGGSLTGQGIAPGFSTETSVVDFKMSPDMVTAGLKVALAF